MKAVRLGMRIVKGRSTANTARIVAARADEPFASPNDLWRRSRVPTAALVKLAEADAFLPSLQLQRRDALRALKGLRDEPLELWAAAAEREARQPGRRGAGAWVALPAMRTGHEVVEDYSHVGLTLRQHPIAFLRENLRQKRMVTCAEANGERDGRWLMTGGLILVRQRPGSATGATFMTLEDETGIVNAVIWPKVFERQRRLVLSASMLAINGKIQRKARSFTWLSSGCSIYRMTSGSWANSAIRFRFRMGAATSSRMAMERRIQGKDRRRLRRRATSSFLTG